MIGALLIAARAKEYVRGRKHVALAAPQRRQMNAFLISQAERATVMRSGPRTPTDMVEGRVLNRRRHPQVGEA